MVVVVVVADGGMGMVIDGVGALWWCFIYDVCRTKNKELGNSRQNI